RPDELDASRSHAVVSLREVVDPKEEPDAPRDLLSDDSGLVVSIGASEEHAGLTAGRPDHDPPLRPPVARQRGRVLDELEPESVDEELDCSVVVVDDDCYPLDAHLESVRTTGI